jgi:hypothetical protein
MKRPAILWLLVFLLVFLAIGGFYGGVFMLIDPSGELLQMDEVLTLLPVPDYTLPGLFLIIVMGIFPLMLCFGLIWMPDCKWGKRLADWSGHSWAWTGSVAVGLILVIWLIIQSFLIGFQWPIQYVTLVNGILIVLVAFIPGLRKFYKRPA